IKRRNNYRNPHPSPPYSPDVARGLGPYYLVGWNPIYRGLTTGCLNKTDKFSRRSLSVAATKVRWSEPVSGNQLTGFVSDITNRNHLECSSWHTVSASRWPTSWDR